MATLDLLRTIKIRAQTEGMEAAEGAMNRARVATKNLDGSIEDVAKSMGSNERAIKSLLRAHEEGYSAAEKLTKAQKDLSIGIAAGRVSQEQALRVYDAAADKLLGLSKAHAAEVAEAAKSAAANEALRSKYDTAFAAAKKLEMATVEIARAHKEAGLSADLAAAAVRKETQAYNEQITALSKLSQMGKDSAKRTVIGSGGFSSARDREADVNDSFGRQFDERRAKYDEVFRAGQVYRAGLKELRADLATGAISEDLYTATLAKRKSEFADQVKGLNGMAEAERKAAKEADAAAAAAAKAANAKPAKAVNPWENLQGSAANPNAAASRALGSMSSTGMFEMTDQAKRLRAELVPLAGAQMQYDATVARSADALKARIIDQKEHDAVVARASGTLLNQRNEINKATLAHERMAKGAGLNAYAVQNLSFQVNDVATSLASGISPMQTFAQQGGQIFQILQSDQGGVRGGLRSIGDMIKGIATPGRLMFAGLAAGAVTAAYALSSYNAEQAKLRTAVGGIGRATGATVGNVNALAPSAARAAGISTSEARELAGTFAATGKIGVDMFTGLIKVTKDYSILTGTELPEASKELAEAFASPTAGAETLNAKTGFLTRSLYESIRAMEESGNRSGAQKALMDALSMSTANASTRLGFFTKQWEDFKNTTSNEVGAIGGFISKGLGIEDAEERVRTLQGQLDFRAARKGSMGGLFDSIWGFDEDQIRRDLAKAKAIVDAQSQTGQDAKTAQKGLQIGSIVDQSNPQLRALEQMEGKAKTIRDEFDRLRITNPFGPAYDTMVGLERAAKQIRSDMEAGGQAYADSTRATKFEASTVGFTDFGRAAAEINNRASERGITANREFQNNNNGDQYAKALASIENDRLESLKTLNEKTKQAESNLGTSLGRMAPALQQQVLEAGKMFGKVPAGLIAAIAGKESTNNLKVGYSTELGENGKPSSAYGLGQITKGTAEAAIKGGYLPQGFDRMNEATMAQGIAGVLAMKIDEAGGNVTKGVMNYRGSKIPGVNEAYAAGVLRKAGQMGDASDTGVVKDLDAGTQAAKALGDRVKINAQLYGENGLKLEASTAAADKYNAAIARGVQPSDALRKAIEDTALASASAAQKMKLDTYSKDLGFEREQMGRSTGDQAAFSKARGMFGDTTSEASQFVIQQERMNDNLRLTKQLGGEAFTGFATDISHGVTAMSALTNAFTRFADKIVSTFADKAFSSLFGSTMGGSGGGGFSLASLFGGGGGGIDVGAQSWMPKFARGGVSNRPSIFGEAGPEAAVPLPDGRHIPVVLSQPNNDNGGLNVQVNNTVSDRTETQVSQAPDGTMMIDIVDKGMAKKAGMGRSSYQKASQAPMRG